MVGILELRVIQALKQIHQGSIRDILDELGRSSSPGESIPAYTTVATVLTRLAQKKHVQVREERFRQNQKKLVYIYEDVEKTIIDALVFRFVEAFGDGA